MDEKNIKESELKNTSSEVASMRNEILRLSKGKDAAVQECKRLQEDLAACTADNRNCHTELDIARRQIDDLKRQLQHYVAEVKRIEDMIAQKEVERSEMLDQFRSLSHEATILENNNHSLENEATQSKVQLSVALDHATGLERRLEEQNSLIRTYERQISELTTQIATLEMQVKHYQTQQERAQTELASVQEMCVNLDKQKQDLQLQLREQQHLKDQAEHNLSTLRRNSETLKKTLQQDQTTVESLETLLAENRRQAVDQRLLNQDLQSEILRLKKQIEEMEMNLASTTERLDIYQEKTLEYSEQNKQLRREITDERFFQSKDEEQSSYKYPKSLEESVHEVRNKSMCTCPVHPSNDPKVADLNTAFLGDSTEPEEKEIKQDYWTTFKTIKKKQDNIVQEPFWLGKFRKCNKETFVDKANYRNIAEQLDDNSYAKSKAEIDQGRNLAKHDEAVSRDKCTQLSIVDMGKQKKDTSVENKCDKCICVNDTYYRFKINYTREGRCNCGSVQGDDNLKDNTTVRISESCSERS